MILSHYLRDGDKNFRLFELIKMFFYNIDHAEKILEHFEFFNCLKRFKRQFFDWNFASFWEKIGAWSIFTFQRQ